MKKFIVIAIILALLGFGGYKVYKYIDDEAKAWKVEVIVDTLNIRDDSKRETNKIGEAHKGEKYKVLEIYLDDPRYVWYRIKFANKKTGWVGSERNNPTVKEINNPDNKDYSEDSYFIDYAKPIVKFYSNDYHVYDYDSINYNHLEIIEDSDYTVNYQVYYEEFPTDRDTPQYWIEWVVEDAVGYKTVKRQRIIFEVEPAKDDPRIKTFVKD